MPRSLLLTSWPPWPSARSRCARHGGPSARQTMTFEAPRDLRDPATRDAALDEIGASASRAAGRPVLAGRRARPAVARQAGSSTRPTRRVRLERLRARDRRRPRPRLAVLLTVTGPVPRWATNGARDNVTRPSPNEFQQFMQAVGRHYGDRVEAFSIWNEPNQPQFLARSTTAQRGRRRRGSTAACSSPRARAARARRGATSRCSSARPRRAAPARSSRR